MDRRLLAIQKIKFSFAVIVANIKSSSSLNLTDLNTVAEDLFKTLFNLIYGYNLKNANTLNQNESAIDLFSEKEKIAYQITSQNKPRKISETVESFIRNEKHKHYVKFIIFSITTDNKCNAKAMEKLNQYDIQHEYINVIDLERYIFTTLETDKLEHIAKYLEFETNTHLKDKPTILNEIDEQLTKAHIVDQIHTTLGYFKGFNLIYPRTLSKIFPFNLEKRTYDSYSNYCLKTNNKSIHELLQKVHINDKKEIELSDDELLPYKDKLKEIFTILNKSLIHCICYRENHIEIEHHKISIFKTDSDCNCNRCLYYDFKLKPIFSQLKQKSITHSINLNEALDEGYYLCKIGLPVKGWQIFNSIIEKTSISSEPILHFLAQHNSYSIYNFIDNSFWANESKAILPEIEKIDLHNIISKLNIPVIVRDELIKVKEDYHLNYSRDKIDEYANKILSIKTLYDNNGSSGSMSYTKLLHQEVHLLLNFYISNNIIADDFSNFKIVITKAINAFMVSYKTNDRYESKYKSFDSIILIMMIFYTEEDSLKNIFIENDVMQINVLEKDKNDLIETITNLFTSQYEEYRLVGIKLNNDISNQEYFSHFRQFLRQVFNRSMLLLSKIDFSHEQIKQIIQPLINFLSVSEDLSYSNWQFITYFLVKHINAFDDNQIKTIIELTISDKNHRNGESYLSKICESVSTKTNFIINDPIFFEKITNKLFNPCNSCERVHDIRIVLALCYIINEDGKQIIKQKSIEYLEKDFDADFYQYAAFKNIFTKHDNLNLLAQYIEYGTRNCTKFDLKEEHGEWIFQSYSGYNFINCIAYMNIDFNNENIKQIATTSEYYNWLINYSTYDYSNFNFKWLIQACPHFIKEKIHIAPQLRDKVLLELKRNFTIELSEFYIEFLN